MVEKALQEQESQRSVEWVCPQVAAVEVAPFSQAYWLSWLDDPLLLLLCCRMSMTLVVGYRQAVLLSVVLDLAAWRSCTLRLVDSRLAQDLRVPSLTAV